MDDMFTTSFDENGQMRILPLPTVGELSGSGKVYKSMLEYVISEPQNTIVNLTENDENVLIGDINSGTIDIADALSVGENTVNNTAGVVIHEISEQFKYQSGAKQKISHDFGIQTESNFYNGGKPGPITTATIHPANNSGLPHSITKGYGFIEVSNGSKSIYIDYKNKNIYNVNDANR